MNTELPPGQQARPDFPRFGLSQFTHRFPAEPKRATLQIGGEVETPLTLEQPLGQLPRVEQTSDFHCVTTWTHRNLRWGGVRFVDFYRTVIEPRATPNERASVVFLRGQDGARTCMLLEDLLQPDVLLADQLNDKPLEVAHGAPLRLVAPSHYGYKSMKYLSKLEFRFDQTGFKPAAFAFMDHLRARVAQEERGRGAPGWLLRYLYRPLVRPTVHRFAQALLKHQRGES